MAPEPADLIRVKKASICRLSANTASRDARQREKKAAYENIRT